jgi:Zn finger protein HypA/HybF involved in hydrogenase expression
MKISALSNKEELEKAISLSVNRSDILRYFNLKAGSGNFRTLINHCNKFQLKLPNSGIKNGKSKTRMSNEKVFCKESTVARHVAKNRIIKNNLIEYKCVKCGLGNEWNNEPISLQLEHINGINNDNRLENLAFICPNCHSQTDTYAGKNKKYARVV